MTKLAPVDEATSTSIWSALVTHCGASETGLDEFVRFAGSGQWTEYRFQGLLGFGGKVWNVRDTFRVSCYPEDSTPSRSAMIEAANKELNDIYKRRGLTS